VIQPIRRLGVVNQGEDFVQVSRSSDLIQKYATDYSLDFFNPDSTVCFRVRPSWAFGLTESDFTGSPTRWLFPPTTD